MSLQGLRLPLFTVDAFADVPFSGNQAAVVLVSSEMELKDSLLQKIASEMNYANTGFIQQLSSDQNFTRGSRFGLRWFTPADEVKLCGHATLASAAVLFQELGNKNEVIEFETKYSGNLHVRKSGGNITIDLPLNVSKVKDKEEFADIIENMSCGFEVKEVAWNEGLSMLLIRLSDFLTREEFEHFQPDLRKAVKQSNEIKMVTVTMKADPKRGFTDKNGKTYDFVSRFFAPWFGVDEDSVTGAAHTVLSDYWAKVMKKKEFYARQCSKRGGNVAIKVEDNRVKLTGRGIVIVRGTISVDGMLANAKYSTIAKL